jgi:hypothetical protein
MYNYCVVTESVSTDCCIWFQFIMVKAYQTKLVAIKKEMIQLHDRATKLKVSICLQQAITITNSCTFPLFSLYAFVGQ